MAISGIDSCQRERNASIDQFDGIFPVDAKLARLPAILFGPFSLTVIARSAVTDLLDHFQMIDGYLPVSADHRHRRR
jgi:hypothetical protein